MKWLKTVAKKALIVVACLFGLIALMAGFWFFGNAIELDWRPNPEVVAYDFAMTMNSNLPPQVHWNVVCTNAGFPGPQLILSTKATNGTVLVGLDSFLGLGWQKGFYHWEQGETNHSN